MSVISKHKDSTVVQEYYEGGGGARVITRNQDLDFTMIFSWTDLNFIFSGIWDLSIHFDQGLRYLFSMGTEI